MNSSSKAASKIRKREAKKLDYKKLFLFIFIIIAVLGTIWYVIAKNSNSTKSPLTPVAEIPKDSTVKMTVVGDIMCHSTNFKAAYNSSTKTYDFSDVFTQIEKYVQNADISIGNIETTFAGEEVGYSGYPTFNTPAALAQDLVELGIDVVSTANNHSLDKRYSGLVSTLDELDAVGISHTGTYRSVEEQNTILTKDVNGIKFAFLSFTYGTNGIPVPSGKEYCVNLIDENLMLKQIELAKAQNPDVICVNMHWGDEYKFKPNSTQKNLADFLFENGVDIILGSHPHVLEPMEKRTITLADGTTKEGFLIYSLGNFMSGQVITDTRYSLILNLEITKSGETGKISISSYDYIPTYMLDKGSASTQRYKILDIKSCIETYENGDTSIGKDLYSTLVNALEIIKGVMEPSK